jgi:ribokinase
VVVGSANVDHTVWVEHLPGPGETVTARRVSTSAGGKGLNQAVAAARMGAPTSFLGCVGRDADGDVLLALLDDAGVDVQTVARHAQARTGTAAITVDQHGENTIVVAPEANGLLDAEHVAQAGAAGLFDHAAVVVAQLECPPSTVAAALAAARQAGAITMLNPAGDMSGAADLLHLADLCILNHTEAAAIVGPTTDPAESARRLLALGCGSVVITKGAAGAWFFDGGNERHVETHRVEVVDATGAGDAFCGAYAVAWAEGRPVDERLAWASAAGASAVTRAGAAQAMPTRADVESLLA